MLSKRTVEKHISSILSKLALTNRAQVVRWAIDNGLTERRAVSSPAGEPLLAPTAVLSS